jgi:hypothetical protein
MRERAQLSTLAMAVSLSLRPQNVGTIGLDDIVLPSKERKKAARGRGNQGDHAIKRHCYGELEEHKAHNSAVTMKKRHGSIKSMIAQAKKRARKGNR